MPTKRKYHKMGDDRRFDLTNLTAEQMTMLRNAMTAHLARLESDIQTIEHHGEGALTTARHLLARMPSFRHLGGGLP